jgi:type II secretory pathway predicted ATPase ExeA
VSAAPWAAHFGLARTPFGKSIPARDLFPRQAHAEAIARISFCIVECALAVVTGDVGAGKTVALRAAVAALDPTRHQVIYMPTRRSALGACMSPSSGHWAPGPAT